MFSISRTLICGAVLQESSIFTMESTCFQLKMRFYGGFAHYMSFCIKSEAIMSTFNNSNHFTSVLMKVIHQQTTAEP